MGKRRNRRKRQQGTPQGVLKLSGVDWLESEPISADTPDGALVAAVALSPVSLRGTHLAAVADAYERFRFTQLEVELSARIPATVMGGYIAGVSVDPQPPALVGTAMKRYVRTLAGAVTAPWSMSRKCRHAKAQDEKWYNTQSREVQGLVLVAVDGAPANLVGASAISLSLKWTIELRDPAVAVAAVDYWDIPAGTKIFVDGTGSIKAMNDWLRPWTDMAIDTVYVVVPPIAGRPSLVTYLKKHTDRDGAACLTTWFSYTAAAAAKEPDTNRDGDSLPAGTATTVDHRIHSLSQTNLPGPAAVLENWRRRVHLPPRTLGQSSSCASWANVSQE